jgi:hypothetical protein
MTITLDGDTTRALVDVLRLRLPQIYNSVADAAISARNDALALPAPEGAGEGAKK